MHNLKLIHEELENLRHNKKTFKDISTILIKKGYDVDVINHAIRYKKKKEENDYNKLKHEMDSLNFFSTGVGYIFLMIISFLSFVGAIYFLLECLKVFQTPDTFVSDRTIIQYDFLQKSNLTFLLFIAALVLLIISIPLFGKALKSIKKVKKDRKRLLFLKERV